jgi:hypothetical protein
MNIEEVKADNGGLAPSPASQKTEAKNETQELLTKLEKELNEAVQQCASVDADYEKLLVRRGDTEKKRFQALLNLTSVKEQLMMNTINQLQRDAKK